jgi:hypothetical protein
MTTLAEAILALSKVLQNTIEGTATGGSTTTLEDALRKEAEDYYDGGTLWFLSGSLSGKTAVVMDWVPTRFTVLTQTAAVAAGVSYAAAGGEFPKWLMVQKINEAYELLAIPQTNETLITVAYQESYTLPAGVYNVKRVEVAGSSASPYYYGVSLNWYELNGKIYFDTGSEPIEDAYPIRLSYLPRLADLSSDTDVLNDQVPLEALKWHAAVLCYRWLLGKYRDDRPDKIRGYNDALLQAARYPMTDLSRDPHLSGW